MTWSYYEELPKRVKIRPIKVCSEELRLYINQKNKTTVVRLGAANHTMRRLRVATILYVDVYTIYFVLMQFETSPQNITNKIILPLKCMVTLG